MLNRSAGSFSYVQKTQLSSIEAGRQRSPQPADLVKGLQDAISLVPYLRDLCTKCFECCTIAIKTLPQLGCLLLERLKGGPIAVISAAQMGCLFLQFFKRYPITLISAW